jgi:hypothetical protein
MKSKLFVLGLIALLAPAVSANAATMKECAAQWQQMKAAKTTGGKTYKEFSKECMSGSSGSSAATPAATTTPPPSTAAAPAAPTRPATASAPTSTTSTSTSTTTEKKPVSAGREAMYSRERECGKEWKEAKAAGKTGNMKWPQYWSECNKRLKAAGK